MQIDAGAHVLDIGCGHGIDTIPLANVEGRTGTVVGVDVDESMVAQAEAQAREMGVTARVVHQQGDVGALPFSDATFDACRAEWLFQVLASPADPMRAMADPAGNKTGWPDRGRGRRLGHGLARRPRYEPGTQADMVLRGSAAA